MKVVSEFHYDAWKVSKLRVKVVKQLWAMGKNVFSMVLFRYLPGLKMIF
jgi:hypothetical protein